MWNCMSIVPSSIEVVLCASRDAFSGVRAQWDDANMDRRGPSVKVMLFLWGSMPHQQVNYTAAQVSSSNLQLRQQATCAQPLCRNSSTHIDKTGLASYPGRRMDLAAASC